MPLKLNIGLSQKVGQANYGSRGASVNVELELDSTLIGDPAKLQDRIRHLFGLVRLSLAEELNSDNGHAAGSNHTGEQTRLRLPANDNGNGNGGGNGHTTNHLPDQRGNSPRPATPAQIKAIHGIARKLRIDLALFLKDRFQIFRPDELSLPEASQVIDELRALGTSTSN